jgi:hypothetical protein
MPHHDIYCEVCGEVFPDQYLPLYTLPEPRIRDGYRVTQDFDRPIHCGQEVILLPPRVVMDAKEPFQQFQVEIPQPDGSHRAVTVGSLRQMRQIERASEQAARNGEGQPLVWRDYSQDRSNFDKHTLGEAPNQAPPAAAAERFGLQNMRPVRDGDAAPGYGPGVSDANTSALPGGA